MAYHITLIIRSSNVRLIPFNILIMRAFLVFLTLEVMKGICYFYFFTSYYDTIDIRQLRPPTIFTWDQIPHSSPTYQAHCPQTHEYFMGLSRPLQPPHPSHTLLQLKKCLYLLQFQANNNNAAFGGKEGGVERELHFYRGVEFFNVFYVETVSPPVM